MKYDIDINSYIGYPFSKEYVKALLRSYKDRSCKVRIDSLGGSVNDALDIRQQFIDHGDVTAYIFGMTASAATVLAMGAKKIYMSKYALMLVHCCSLEIFEWAQVNAEELDQKIKELQSSKDTLETLDQLIANIYLLKTGKPAEEITKLMQEAKWLTAQECLELGLVDEIIEEDVKPVFNNAIGGQIAACGLPLPNIQDDDAEKESLISSITKAVRSVLGCRSQKEIATAGNEVDGYDAQEANETDDTQNPESVDSGNPSENAEVNNNQKAITMNESFKTVNAVLNIAGITQSEDGTLALTIEQMTAINDRLSALETENKDLQQQVENLSKAPGDETTDVNPEAEDASDVTGVVEMYNLYKNIL